MQYYALVQDSPQTKHKHNIVFGIGMTKVNTWYNALTIIYGREPADDEIPALKKEWAAKGYRVRKIDITVD
jgi:hypothetical protein